MEIRNQSSVPQLSKTSSVEISHPSTGWGLGKIVGKIASVLGFKANIASPEQQQGRLAQNSATKQEIESRIIAIDKQLEKLPSKESIRASVSLQRQLQEEALHNTKLTLGQEKGRLLEQLANGDYKLSAPAASRSSSPVTVSRKPSPSPSQQAQKTSTQRDLERYQEDKRKIAVNERLMEKPSGFYSAVDKSRIAQDTWDRQLRVDQYEKDHPEVLTSVQ